MKFVLKKNLEMGGKQYLEGEEIEVTKEEYAYLMQSYMDERKALLEKEKEENIPHFNFVKDSK